MSKLLKSHAAGLPEIKNRQHQEENLTKHVGFVYAYVKKAKIEKLTMIKMAARKKSKPHDQQ